MVHATGSVCLEDGRSVTFRATGPEDGFPVVYCHGAIGAPRWRSAQVDALLERLGIRYLVINRPGFAGSDPDPGRTVADFAGDVGQLMTALGYWRFSVVGVSAGAPYALACGSVMPERICALAAVSALGPPDGAGATRSVRYCALRLPFGPGRGRELFTRICLKLLRLERDTDPTAMVHDYLVCRSHWGFELSALRVPVTLWHGRGDRLIPLSHGRRLAAAIPDCTPRVDASGGHFFYNRGLEQIVSSLLPAPAPYALAA